MGMPRQTPDSAFVRTLPEYARRRSWQALAITPANTALSADGAVTQAAIDLLDWTTERKYIVGTLRLDYVGHQLKGNWSDAQLVGEIAPTDPDVLWIDTVESPELAGTRGAEWLDAQ